MRRSLFAPVGIFAALVICRNRNFVSDVWHTHGAFDAQSAHEILRYGLLPSAFAAVVCLLAWGLGLRMLRLLRAEEVDERDLMSFGLGMGTLASTSLLLGLCGVFRTAAFLVLGALAAAVGVPEFIRRTREERSSLEDRGDWRLWQGFLAAIIAFSLWHIFITALAPPTDWDVLAYHLALPKLYLRAGRIMEIPWLLHSHWPHLMEVLYAVPLALGMDNAAALLHAATVAALFLATFRVGRKQLGAPAAWIGTAILAVQPALWMRAGEAHSDGAFALFHFLACVALWSWDENGSPGILALAGLLSGLAASAKLLGVAPFIVLSAWVWTRPRREKRHAQTLLFAACGLAVVLPWYLKTWAGAGNPVWPFFSRWLGGRWGAAFFESRYLRCLMVGWPPNLEVLLQYGPQFLLLPAAIGAAWTWRRRLSWPPFLKFLLTPAAFYFLMVARHTECWRLMQPMLPALALTAGWGVTSLAQGRAGKIAATALVLFALYPIRGATQNEELSVALGSRSITAPGSSRREAYLNDNLDNYHFYRRLHESVGPGDKVLLFQEIRGYYLDVDYMWGDPLNQGMIRYAELRGPDELAAELTRLGVTHVLESEDSGIYGENPDYYDRRTIDMMRDMLRLHARPMMKEGGLALYQLIG
jgi:hypothetical protein